MIRDYKRRDALPHLVVIALGADASLSLAADGEGLPPRRPQTGARPGHPDRARRRHQRATPTSSAPRSNATPNAPSCSTGSPTATATRAGSSPTTCTSPSTAPPGFARLLKEALPYAKAGEHPGKPERPTGKAGLGPGKPARPKSRIALDCGRRGRIGCAPMLAHLRRNAVLPGLLIALGTPRRRPAAEEQRQRQQLKKEAANSPGESEEEKTHRARGRLNKDKLGKVPNAAKLDGKVRQLPRRRRDRGQRRQTRRRQARRSSATPRPSPG